MMNTVRWLSFRRKTTDAESAAHLAVSSPPCGTEADFIRIISINELERITAAADTKMMPESIRL